MKTKLSASALFSAETAYNAEFVDYYDTNLVDYETPESIVVKQDNYNKLSSSAKEVITTVLNVPVELFQLLLTKQGNVSKTAVKNYFTGQFGKAKADIVFAEIAAYIN
jgi:hypothetical protein